MNRVPKFTETAKTNMPGAWYANPDARGWTCEPVSAAVRQFHATLPGYAVTPLREIPPLAQELSVGRVFVKDESLRLGLPAFKVLGASWAVYRAVAARLGGGMWDGTFADLRQLVATRDPIELIAATDGNHGRAVARMARTLGLPSHIFVPASLTERAVTAIAVEGAALSTIQGAYDDAVRAASTAAQGSPDSLLIQDTACPGYEDATGWIVDGYSTLFAEIDEQLCTVGGQAPGLVVIPTGVGSLAQAAVAYYRSRAEIASSLLSVEPKLSACVLASLINGEPTTVQAGATIMMGLCCGTVSSTAWPYLRAGLDAAVAVTDENAARAVEDLAGQAVNAGPCGAAALAGIRAALSEPCGKKHRNQLGLSPTSTVVLLNTEGIDANPLQSRADQLNDASG